MSLPALAHPDDPKLPAKELFGRVVGPTETPAEPIGFYAKGCLSGGVPLPADGPAWQVMRPSRNRNWGHPALVSLVARVAMADREAGLWPGVLVGDMAQPRGGPMLTGHASHQIGLDADLWLRPMPERTLTRDERETLPSLNVVREDGLGVNDNWTPAHQAFIRSFAVQPDIQRIFVNPAIKKELCHSVTGDRAWLSKIRPEHGHTYHIHLRMTCPAGTSNCTGQDPPPMGEGCDASLEWWFKDEVLHPKPMPQPAQPKPPLTMSALPTACKAVVVRP